VVCRYLPTYALLAALAGGAAGSAQAAVPYGPGAIAAVVRDTKGNAIVGALIVAQGPTTRQAVSGAGGLVVLQALPLGPYDVRVTNPGYTSTDTSIVVAGSRSGPQYLDLRLATADLSSASAAAITASTALNPADDPFIGHALVAMRGVDVVPNWRGDGSAAALQGTTPLESRVEVDGIPVADDFSGTAGLRFRNALALDGVDVTLGLAAAPRYTALDTIGGVVTYRTPAFSTGLEAGAEAGYDSSYGSFQHARYSQTFGPLGVLTDLVTGGGENRTQIVKAQYAFSTSTSLAIDSYGSQSQTLVGTQELTNVAPTSAIDLRTKIGSASFEARTYQSSSRTTDDSTFGLATDDRIAGTQVSADVSAGEALLSLGYDRRTEFATASETTLQRSYSTITAQGTIPLAQAVRLELADAYGGGSDLARRHSPHATLTVGAGERLTLRLSAGSAFATLPLDALALLPMNERDDAPETSFGYRGALNFKFDDSDRAWMSLFTLRRFDALAALSQARSRGAEIGFERAQDHAGLGALAYITLQRAYGFGAAQPYASLFALPAYSDMQLSGDAYSKARVAFTFRLPSTLDVRVGTTFLGANNALAQSGFALGDASLGVSLGTLVQARIGIENAFGHRITDPVLAGEYAPRV
jgi:hypothetical protein